MKETFRQSMAWLHTWAGLLTGWVLFFVFLTGTFGYVNHEVTRWMKPELRMVSPAPPASSLLPVAEQWLAQEAPDAQNWFIRFPAGRERQSEFGVGWRAWPKGDGRRGKVTRKALDPTTGEAIVDKTRETGGGNTLYLMHYTLHYMPRDWGILIVGICTMFMFVAILSGIVTHKKIFKDFFTFRPAKGQRSWLDGHNLLSVTALPFHLMITWSGLIFYLFTYMPVAVDALYPAGKAREVFYADAYGRESRADGVVRSAAPLTNIAPLLAQAELQWGAGSVGGINIDHPGHEDARIKIYSHSPDGPSEYRSLQFDGVSGARIPNTQRSTPSQFSVVILALHEGLFAGPILRLLYVIAGLVGTAMIATGLLLWSAKRKAKLKQAQRPNFGIVAVDVLNLGTIIGLPIGIAVYFCANRLIPVGIEGRGAWEVNAMFIAWGLTFLYAIWRRLDRAWIELAWLAASSWGLLPVLNALTTNRHLGVTIPAGDWALASIDLGMLTAGLFFALFARSMARKHGKAGGSRLRRLATLSTGGASRVIGPESILPGTPPRLRSDRASYRWSVASRTLAGVGGGYAVTSLFNLALPLMLGAAGVNAPQALLATTMSSFLLYAAIILAVFQARSATRAWAWLIGAALPLAAAALLLWPEARA